MSLPFFAAGQPMTAADANTLARQGVVPVADLTARDALPVPHDGMVVFVEDQETYYGYVGGAWAVLWSDSGYIELTRAVGVGGSVAIRKVGNMVEILVNVTGTFATGLNGLTVEGAVPEEYRTPSPRRGSAVAGTSAACVYLTPSGLVGLRNDSGASRTSADGSIVYFLEP